MSTPLEEAIVALTKSIQTLTTQHEKITEKITILLAENDERKQEMLSIRKMLKPLLTDDETAARNGDTVANPAEEKELNDEDESLKDHFRLPPPSISRHHASQVDNNVEPKYEEFRFKRAKDLVDTIKPLRGWDNFEVEDFIRMVERAKSRCYEPDILLDIIVAIKIIDQAERSIRHLQINTYDDLYGALRTYVFPSVSPDVARDKLYSVIQGRTESVVNYTLRFRQQLSEYRYATENEYTQPATRQRALSILDKEVVRMYVKSLRYELAAIVQLHKPSNISEAQGYALEAETLERVTVRMTRDTFEP